VPNPLRAQPPEPVASESERLRNAMTIVVSRSLRTTVNESPQEFSDTIAPVILPAIKNSISIYFNELIQSLQKVLENSLSSRSIQWRFEAIRTGRSFSEIALLHSLIYRVDEVMLIEHESGLLVGRASTPDSPLREPEVISGMVTALNDFIRDSFQLGTHPTSGSLQYGDYTVWTERGQKLTVAAFIRGSPSPKLRDRLRQALFNAQQVPPHLRQAGQNFEDILRPCLAQELRQPKARSRMWKYVAVILVCLPLLAMIVWIGLGVQHGISVAKYEQALRGVPGIVIQKASYRDGRVLLEGIRDPASPDPASKLRADGLDPGQASLELKPYFSAEPAIVSKRALTLLKAPDSVNVDVDGTRVVLHGNAPMKWIKKTKSKLEGLETWVSADFTRLMDSERIQISSLEEQVEAIRFPFKSGSARVSADQAEAVTAAAKALRQIGTLSRTTGRNWKVKIQGMADATGPPSRNIELSRLRAHSVARALASQGVPFGKISSQGLGGSAGSKREAMIKVEIIEGARDGT